MYNYLISYERNGKAVTAKRKADCASGALEALCRQYNWGFRSKMISADDNGISWATASADTEGGINYNLGLIATIEK